MQRKFFKQKRTRSRDRRIQLPKIVQLPACRQHTTSLTPMRKQTKEKHLFTHAQLDWRISEVMKFGWKSWWGSFREGEGSDHGLDQRVAVGGNARSRPQVVLMMRKRPRLQRRKLRRTRGHFWAVSVGSRAKRFLTFWRSMGGFSGEQDVFMKTRFLSKNYEKCSTTSDNAISNPPERKKVPVRKMRSTEFTTWMTMHMGWRAPTHSWAMQCDVQQLVRVHRMRKNDAWNVHVYTLPSVTVDGYRL